MPTPPQDPPRLYIAPGLAVAARSEKEAARKARRVLGGIHPVTAVGRRNIKQRLAAIEDGFEEWNDGVLMIFER
jgi:hypothetical protein